MQTTALTIPFLEQVESTAPLTCFTTTLIDDQTKKDKDVDNDPEGKDIAAGFTIEHSLDMKEHLDLIALLLCKLSLTLVSGITHWESWIKLKKCTTELSQGMKRYLDLIIFQLCESSTMLASCIAIKARWIKLKYRTTEPRPLTKTKCCCQ